MNWTSLLLMSMHCLPCAVELISMAAWSQLPSDIWCSIGEKLHDTADRIRFRSVCSSWRSTVPFPQPPWLMLAEDAQSPYTRGFFGLGHQQREEEQKVYQLELPEAHLVRCVGSIGTWLITINGHERIRLLNPFSRRQFDLPSQRTLQFGLGYNWNPGCEITPEVLRDSRLRKAIISSPPSSGNCIAMVLHQGLKSLAVARLGDTSWTTVPTPMGLFFKDIIFYKQQFYGIDYNGILVVCDHLSHPPTATMLTTEKFKTWCKCQLFYLVEWMEELLFVIKSMDCNDDAKSYKADRFQVYIFDFTNKSWTELRSLGDYSLFLGLNSSAAVLASCYPGLKKNCIYFTDNFTLGYRSYRIPGGTDMGVFDLEDNSIVPHYKGTSTCLYSPPLWIVPQIHPPAPRLVN